VAEIELNPLPPAEAISFFRGKGLQESYAWQDVDAQEHARAFTVAKAMRRDVLYDVREALDRAIAEGRTFESFARDLEPLLRSKGWWGRGRLTDPMDGVEKDVQLGSARRLRTIFDVNLRSAFQAGRWERIQATRASLPYLRYVAVGGKAGDGRTRPEHREWHGTILPVDHPWWRTHYPPCGFRCRCTVVQLNLRTIERRGWTVTEEPVKFPPVAYVNPRTGETAVLERGIDPGFNYNVGEAWLDGSTPRAGSGLPEVARLVSGGRPPIAPRPERAADIGIELLEREDARAYGEASFMERFDLARTGAKVFTDAGGEPFAISPALFTRPGGRDRNFGGPAGELRAAAEAIADPDEIRWVWTEAEKPMLLRRYIRRIAVAGSVIDVVVDAASGGSAPWWSFRTSFEGELALDEWRGGVLAWRRPAED
jgi:SPP1 gp7 family putative phage head morphogenesis protein